MSGDCATCIHAIPRWTRAWNGHMSRPVLVFGCKISGCQYEAATAPALEEAEA